jgi:hypothetical protein
VSRPADVSLSVLGCRQWQRRTASTIYYSLTNHTWLCLELCSESILTAHMSALATLCESRAAPFLKKRLHACKQSRHFQSQYIGCYYVT